MNDDLIMHPAFRNLSCYAKVTLMYMKNYAEKMGEIVFPFSTNYLTSLGVMANKTAIESLKELEQAGFIEKVYSGKGIVTSWQFINKWRWK